jgi:hypothetical protein
MQGFQKVFIFSAAISAVAIVCSSLRGSEDKEESPAMEAAMARPADQVMRPTAPR